MIGTLVSYPLCLLSDLERFSDLVGRGCPAQSGHAINISVTGQCSPCVHQSNSKDNILIENIRTIYARMRAWHDGTYTHAACTGCLYLGICRSGCRSSANAYTNSFSGPDHLMTGPSHFLKPFELVQDPTIIERIRKGAQLRVPKRIRYRKEDGFYLLNIRWANTITCAESLAKKLIARIGGDPFTIKDIGQEYAETLAQLYWKDALESSDIIHSEIRDKHGLSASVSSNTL